jgi:chromosome partitioning protein
VRNRNSGIVSYCNSRISGYSEIGIDQWNLYRDMETASTILSTSRPKPFVQASPGAKKTTTTRKIEGGVNKKGGVGKTTTTLNLGEELGMRGYQVLVVDLDSSASLTEATGIDLSQLDYKVDDVLLTKAISIQQAIIRPEHLHFDLLPGSPTLSHAEPTLAVRRDQDALIQRLKPIESSYDFVILDTAGAENFISSLGHKYADEVVVPVECDDLAWNAFMQTMQTLNTVREGGLNPRLRIRTILVTRYQPQKTNVSDAFLEKLRRHFGSLVFPDPVVTKKEHKEALRFAVPVVAYAPESQGGRVYKALAEFLEHE